MNRFFPYALALLLVVLFSCGTPFSLSAQTMSDSPAMQSETGLFANFNINSHRADFQQLSPDYPTCCPLFEEGDGAGFNGGLLYTWPWTDAFGLQPRLGVHSFSGTLLREEPTQVASPDGELFDGIFEHSIDATLISVGLEPLLEFQLFNGFSLYGGPYLAYRAVANFEQKEEITQPDFGVFEDTQTRVRNRFADDVPDVERLALGLSFGISYDLPLNSTRTALLAPEVFYTLGLNNISSSVDWQVDALRVGVAVKWVRTSAPPADRREELPPAQDDKPIADQTTGAPEVSITTEPISVPTASLKVKAIEDQGEERLERDVAALRVEEFLTDRMVPLLNYIFFDEGQAVIPARYNTDVSSPESGQNAGATLDIYYNVLNIIGRRLSENPSAEVNIVGCNADYAAERGNVELSNRRAEMIEDFLATNWKVSRERINTSGRNLPAVPSNSESEDGRAENRRAEIGSNDAAILSPLLVSDTLRRLENPIVRLYPKANTRRGVRTWNVTVKQDGRELFSREGRGAPPPHIDWTPAESGEKALKGGSLQMTFEYIDKDGKTVRSAEPSLPVELVTIQRKREQGVGNTRVDRFSLILFDYNSAELGERNREIVEMIQNRVADHSTVRIEGYTDRTGDAEFNLDLSSRRADNTERALGLDGSTAVGYGEDVLLFDNSFPEGRFYCRTVEVEVETPVED